MEPAMSLSPADATDLFRQAPDRFIDVGAGEVAVRTIGTGPDVLFVHGWPVSGATYRLLLPHLVDHVTCHVIDLPSAGDSRFDATTPLSIRQHVATVRRVIDEVVDGEVAVVGHDSGGLMARHAAADNPKVRAMGLIDTEDPDVSALFRAFVTSGKLPGFGSVLRWAIGKPRIRRSPLVLGGSFVDRSLLDGEFDELFLAPLRNEPVRLQAAMELLRSFDMSMVTELASVHARIPVPVQLVWGEADPFFPVDRARKMVGQFPQAQLAVVPGAALFSHEERPAEVAAALLPTLTAG
jgi:pimeloyl-ACP methyl ester carboxylesterase